MKAKFYGQTFDTNNEDDMMILADYVAKAELAHDARLSIQTKEDRKAYNFLMESPHLWAYSDALENNHQERGWMEDYA